MAQRRMFSPDIVNSDAFLDMPQSTQALYFHLGMRADDDGFVNPKFVMRLIGSTDDDLKVLLAKRFVLPFASGVVVIKHWLIHNLIRADLYKETLYLEEKHTLGLKDNGAYTELRDGVAPLKALEAPEWLKKRRGTATLRTADVPPAALRLGKDRLGKDNTTSPTGDYPADFIKFWEEYPSKVGKGAALRGWKKLRISPSMLDQIISAVRIQKISDRWAKDDGRYIPNPATWLNQRRWEDDLSAYKKQETFRSYAR